MTSFIFDIISYFLDKWRSPHIWWQKQKVKLNLAAQTFSDAIEYCTNTLSLCQFPDSEATTSDYLTSCLICLIIVTHLPKINLANWESNTIATPFLSEAQVYSPLTSVKTRKRSSVLMIVIKLKGHKISYQLTFYHQPTLFSRG